MYKITDPLMCLLGKLEVQIAEALKTATDEKDIADLEWRARQVNAATKAFFETD